MIDMPGIAARAACNTEQISYGKASSGLQELAETRKE